MRWISAQRLIEPGADQRHLCPAGGCEGYPERNLIEPGRHRNMASARVTHLRHVAVAVPDYEETLDCFGGVWGLTQVDSDKDVAFLAAEGSPEQYVYRIRKAPEKRLDLVA